MKENLILKPPRERFKQNDKGQTEVDLTEIYQYLGLKKGEGYTDTEKIRKDLADAWIEANPQTDLEMKQFYATNELYIWDLFTWDHGPYIWELLDKVITGKERVLDYGAGIGDIAIYLAQKGCDVLAIELDYVKKVKGKPVANPSPTKQFMMHRVYSRKLGDKIKFGVPEPKKIDDEAFDVVLGIDVLEHLRFPLRWVVQLTKLLKNRDSWAFFTPTFRRDTDYQPMHLEENFWLEKDFGLAMQSLALEPEFVIKEYYPIWHPLFKTLPMGAKV